MGSSYYGEPNIGNDRGGCSRKDKKSSSGKPKQPQRGLGVAQLEKIRLQEQMGCSYPPSLFNQMGLGEYDQRANIRYGDTQPSTAAMCIWNPRSGILDSQHFAQPNMTRQLLNVEDVKPKNSKKHRSSSLGSNSQNSESSETQELDLELRLSL
ncbi:hypothetical protein V6N13_081574 [Hibiscus sabdariffa]|uniref:Uncharacterized protein n=1 Tax=Hibiscus sabdariffa TaxID=183260 RepID=A0ABR2DCK9_9ROSI